MNYGYQREEHGVGYYVKAVSNDGTIDVLGCPYGGPLDNRDVHGEFFSPNTDFMSELIPYPPVFYHHGAVRKNHTKMVGDIISRWVDDQGVWYRVKLAIDSKDERYSSIHARRLWEKALKGLLYASSGAIPASVEKSDDGEIVKWLVGELSLFDLNLSRDRFPANFYARAEPTKSGYYRMTKAGRQLFGNTYVRGFRKKVQDIMGEDKFVEALENIAFSVSDWITESTSADNAPDGEAVINFLRARLMESISESPQIVPKDSTAETITNEIVEAMVIDPARLDDTEHIAHMIFVAVSKVIPAVSMPESMEGMDIPEDAEDAEDEESGGNDEESGGLDEGHKAGIRVMIESELKPSVGDNETYQSIVRKILKAMIQAHRSEATEQELEELTDIAIASIELDEMNVEEDDPDSTFVSFNDAVINTIGKAGEQWQEDQDSDGTKATGDRDSQDDGSSGTSNQAKEEGATSQGRAPNSGETEMNNDGTTKGGQDGGTDAGITAVSIKAMVVEALGDEAVIGQFVTAFAAAVNQGGDETDDHKSGGDENADDQFVESLIASGRVGQDSKQQLQTVFSDLRSTKGGTSAQALREVLDANTRTDRYQVTGFKVSETNDGIDQEYMKRFASYVNAKPEEAK